MSRGLQLIKDESTLRIPKKTSKITCFAPEYYCLFAEYRF